MENSYVMNIVLHEIDIIVKEQIMIVRHNAFLEDRRIRLMDFIQNSEILDISNGARENLLKNVSTMEMKVLRVAQTVKDKDIDEKIQKKCRYDDKGYCRNENRCKYQHFAQICEKFLTDGKCEARHRCQFRHPRICKYWKHSAEGCRREEMCKYLHQAINNKALAADKGVTENNFLKGENPDLSYHTKSNKGCIVSLKLILLTFVFNPEKYHIFINLFHIHFLQ